MLDPVQPGGEQRGEGEIWVRVGAGIRVSGRRAEPCPTTRNPHVRLSWPQASVVGAQLPAEKRLYELIVGATKIARSARHAIWPAR